MCKRFHFWVPLLLLCFTDMAAATSPVVDLTHTHEIWPDIVYQHADGIDLQLDIYKPRKAPGYRPADGTETSVPTLVFFHGGGWVGGTRNVTMLHLLPYLEKGWAAVTVQYRLAGTSLAPAAVEDARCAVWWVKRNAREYGFDPDRIVLSGRSAGGHLALMAGTATADAGLDARCPDYVQDTYDRNEAAFPELKVAAIINWAGITDVNDLIKGKNMKTYAVEWMGSKTNRGATATRVSPVTYVREGLPPILTIHGNKDQVVPYQQAVLYHEKLTDAGVQNRLLTLDGGDHFGNFTLEDIRNAYGVIDAFLEQYHAK